MSDHETRFPIAGALARLHALASVPPRPEDVARRLAEAQRRRVGTLKVLARSLEVPEDEDLRAAVLNDDVPVTPALAAVQGALAWRGHRSRGLVLAVGGPPGTGKSVALAHALVRVEQSALFVAATTIGATPRNGFSENDHAWQRWLGVAVLAVDDVGVERGDPEQVAALLWERYDHGRATLVSTNLARQEFAARYLSGEIGRRVADRLIRAQGRAIEGAGGRLEIGPGGQPWFVGVEGESLRGMAARVALRARGEP